MLVSWRKNFRKSIVKFNFKCKKNFLHWKIWKSLYKPFIKYSAIFKSKLILI